MTSHDVIYDDVHNYIMTSYDVIYEDDHNYIMTSYDVIYRYMTMIIIILVPIVPMISSYIVKYTTILCQIFLA